MECDANNEEIRRPNNGKNNEVEFPKGNVFIRVVWEHKFYTHKILTQPETSK